MHLEFIKRGFFTDIHPGHATKRPGHVAKRTVAV
jgi:hypothetical protein